MHPKIIDQRMKAANAIIETAMDRVNDATCGRLFPPIPADPPKAKVGSEKYKAQIVIRHEKFTDAVDALADVITAIDPAVLIDAVEKVAATRTPRPEKWKAPVHRWSGQASGIGSGTIVPVDLSGVEVLEAPAGNGFSVGGSIRHGDRE